MPISFADTLVVGISSSALFDLVEADRVFQERGIRAYREYMLERENDPLEPGTGFALVRALLGLNRLVPTGRDAFAEVVVMSRNSPETGVRIMNAVEHHGLAISRFAFAGGEALADYAKAFQLDLFLSTDKRDVQVVADSGACATALLHRAPKGYSPPADQVRVAFDADAVLFGEDSELLYKSDGLKAFHAAEAASKDEPLSDGPFAAFLRKLAKVKGNLVEHPEYSPVRLAVVTARNAPAQTRVITTLRAWNVYVDAAFFLGGISKDQVLAALRPHIFFDDQTAHVLPASSLVPSGQVPYKTTSPLHEPTTPEVAGAAEEIPLTRSPADLRTNAGPKGNLEN